jgi:hypothetical protein
LRRGLTPGLGAGIGAVLVAAPLFKLTGYVVWIPALVALPVLAWRQHGRGDIPAWAALVLTFAVLTLTWSLLSGAFDRSVYATPDSGIPGSQPTVSSARENIPGYLSYLWQIFLPPLPFMTDLHVQKWPAFDIYIERGFGAFGWYAIKFPMWVYLAIVLAIGAAAALGLRALWQSRASVRAVLPELLVLALLAAAVIAGTHASFYTPEPSRPVVAEQGRYAFTAMVPFAAFAAVAAYGLGHLRARAVAATMLAAMLALNVASQLLALGKFFS